MTDSVYIATTEPYSGKSLVSLGIADLILRRTSRVGVFRPVSIPAVDGERDKNIDLLLSHFGLGLEYEDTFACTRQEAEDLTGQGRYDEVLDRVVESYKTLESRCDFVLCIGTDVQAALELDFDADVARNLGSPVLLVCSAAGRQVGDVENVVRAAVDAFQDKGCHVLGAIVNRAEPSLVAGIRAALGHALDPDRAVLAVIPEDAMLRSPTVGEIAHRLDAEVLYGGSQLHRFAYRYLVIAMQVEHYLPYLTEGALLITPGDRSDVILSALQAHQSESYPGISGIVLTGGLEPAPSVAQLLEGLPERVPIVAVRPDTYQAATQIGAIRSHITVASPKIPRALALFGEFVDTEALEARVSSVQPRGMTPRMFLFGLVEQAKVDKRHIVLAEGEDERILRAAEVLVRRDIVDLTLLGDPQEIRGSVRRLGLEIDLNRTPVIVPEQSSSFGEYARTLFELRQHKGLNLDGAIDLMSDVSYFGTMMVYKGDADGMVSGAVHTTQHTIRPALQFIKARPGFSVVSSVFFMCLEDRVVVYGDCAVNPRPTAEQLAEIAISSADTARAFGIAPRVALLSYSSGDSGKGEEVERVRAATRIARERRPDLKLEGPIQYDAAVAMDVAAAKMPGSEVAGQANVFVFPDLNAGNNAYKAVQRETGAIAIGPVLQGLKRPVNDLSRGCTVEDIINTVVITAIQAQNA